MSTQQTEVVPTNEGGNHEPPPSRWSIVSGVIFRMAIMWMFMSWLRGDNKQGENKNGVPTSLPSSNIFSLQQEISLWVYVSEQSKLTNFVDGLFWHQEGLVYGGWSEGAQQDGTFFFNGSLQLSPNVQNNGSIFIHVYITKSGFVPHPSMEGKHSFEETIYRSKQLNRFKKRTIKKTKNLLTGETKTDPSLLERVEKHGNVEIISHWHPNLTINLVADQTPWTKGKIPAPLDEMVRFSASGINYEPILYLNDYWNLMRDFTPINETINEVSLHLSFQPMSLIKLQLYLSQSMRNQWYQVLGEVEQSDEEQDSLKEAILETNPIMLGLTVAVTLVHSVFEFLAFKNDIQFWKTRESLEGLSVRSVLFGVVQSVIVLLYVIDNDTNFVVKVSIFVGCLIDLWKITKVVSVGLDRENPLLWAIPRPTLTDKSTYVESDTKKYDQLAFKYLGVVLFPLFIAYAVYSILYDEHKGVYSYILSMLYGFLLTFGFIMMTPQLFINYKLKSVAHLPWRMLTYKALNTFIDDIFAFVIRMPTMYRIGCFRDDIVFFIYLYQRYKYRVDPKRVNEFGTSGESSQSQSEEIEQRGGPSGEAANNRSVEKRSVEEMPETKKQINSKKND